MTTLQPLLPLLATFALALPAAAQAEHPRGVTVQHLALDLHLDWVRQQAYGSATLALQAQRPLQRLQLDAAHLKIESITLNGRDVGWRYDGSARDGALDIDLNGQQPAGQALQVRIQYRTGWVNQSDPANIWASNGLGLRWFAPTLTDPRKRRQVWASGEPRSARHWFPCIDDPGLWRSAELTATVERPLQVQAAGTLMGVRDNPDGTRTWHWRARQPHSNQHTLFIVGEYEHLAQDQAGLVLDNLGYPHEMAGVAASVPRLPDVVAFFTDLLGQPLPSDGLRQVFVPDLPWGAAAPGLAMQSENMVDDAGTHADFKYLWNVLQAENAATQWFGIRRGAGDWRHAWLDRGMARHLGGLYSAHANGRDEFLLYTLQADHDTLLQDWQAGVRETLVPSPTPSADFLAGNRPYLRGGAVLHLLRHELGDDTWRRVLRRLAAGRGPMLSADLAAAAAEEAGRPMAWFFEQWLTRPDHPVFELTHQHDAARGELHVSVHQRQDGAPFAGHIVLDVAGQAHRVWLAAQAENRFIWPLSAAPAWVHLDREGSWLKEWRQTPDFARHLDQLRTTNDTLGREWAQRQLVRLARDAGTPATQRAQIMAALLETALRRDLYWRSRTSALSALRGLLTAATPSGPVPLDAPTQAALLTLIRDEGAWLRAGAVALLGLTRDARHAPLYASLLRDPSDRVINNAAVALGQTGSPLAFAALQALPAHTSWKNQSLIAALGGLRELKDPRGAALALAALQDARAERWTLATPVWDHRLAAADTLRALGAGAGGVPLLMAHLRDALAQGHVNDSFYNLQLLVALGQASAREAVALVRGQFATQPEALEAASVHAEQLERHLTESRTARP